MAKHNIFGQEAERKAAQFLEEKGYKILKRNWRYLRLEIDIIAEDLETDEIVIVEVKARIDPMIDPLDSIDKKKRSNLVTAADQYIVSNDIEQECRFDIIVLEKKQDEWLIEHIDNAFSAFD